MKIKNEIVGHYRNNLSLTCIFCFFFQQEYIDTLNHLTLIEKWFTTSILENILHRF